MQTIQEIESEPVTWDAVLQPWQAEPYRLWSLLEMLNFSAHAFFWCGSALRSITADCLAASAGCIDGEAVFLTGNNLDDKACNKALSLLPSIVITFRNIGLLITADTTEELIDDLSSVHRRSFDWLTSQVQAIERLAEKELKNKLFLYIPPERAKYWPLIAQPNLFGNEVANKFPSASFDIIESGQCLAASMSTASVFHLMRVMEIGLTALGKVFGVSLAHTNWGPAIEEIESKIRNMHVNPAWKGLADVKDQQAFYAKAAAHFAITKDAWRNHAMHAREKYTEEEAERIYVSVKAFIQKLAEKLAE